MVRRCPACSGPGMFPRLIRTSAGDKMAGLRTDLPYLSTGRHKQGAKRQKVACDPVNTDNSTDTSCPPTSSSFPRRRESIRSAVDSKGKMAGWPTAWRLSQKSLFLTRSGGPCVRRGSRGDARPPSTRTYKSNTYSVAKMICGTNAF